MCQVLIPISRNDLWSLGDRLELRPGAALLQWSPARETYRADLPKGSLSEGRFDFLFSACQWFAITVSF